MSRIANASRIPGRIAAATLLLLAPAALGQMERDVAYAGTDAGKLYRIDLNDGCVDWVEDIPDGARVECIAASRTGYAVVVATPNDIYLYNDEGGHNVSFPKGVHAPPHHGQISQVAVDRAGLYAAAAHVDGTVRLYQCDPLNLTLSEVWHHAFDARSVSMDTEGRYLAATGPDGVVCFGDGGDGWDPNDATPLWTRDLLDGFSNPSEGLTGSITPSINTTPDNLYVAVGGRKDWIWCFDKDGAQEFKHKNPAGGYITAAVAPDGHSVVAGNDDSTDTKGAVLEMFHAGGSGTPYCTWDPSTNGRDDCYAIVFRQFSTWPVPNDFIAGGSGNFKLHRFDTAACTPDWNGQPATGRQRLAYLDLTDTTSWVVTGGPFKPQVAIHRTGQAAAQKVLALTGNCRALSTAYGREVVGGGSCSLGTSYCIAAPNSVGAEGAHIFALGSDIVADNDFTMLASGAPPKKTGLFFYGYNPTQMPFQDGHLCVMPPIRRTAPIQIDEEGLAENELDLQQLGIFPGATYFQLWYRDPKVGIFGANLSNAVQVDFQ